LTTLKCGGCMYFGSWKYCPKTFKYYGAIIFYLLVFVTFFWIYKKRNKIKF